MLKKILLAIVVIFNTTYSFADDLDHEIDDIISEQMHQYNIVGASITVMENFKPIWSKNLGYANFDANKKVSNNTIFDIGKFSDLANYIEKLYEAKLAKSKSPKDQDVLQKLKLKQTHFSNSIQNIQSQKAKAYNHNDINIEKIESDEDPLLVSMWTNSQDLAMLISEIQKSLKGNSELIDKKTSENLLLGKPQILRIINNLNSSSLDDKDGKYFAISEVKPGFSTYVLAHRENGNNIVILTNTSKLKDGTEDFNFAKKVAWRLAMKKDWDDN